MSAAAHTCGRRRGGLSLSGQVLETNAGGISVGKSRKQKVAAAVNAIRDFHALGGELPKKETHGGAYAKGTMADEARTRRTNPDTLRKARQFADPAAGYTPQELNDLCRLIRRVQREQDDGLAVLGKSHVLRLLTVRPKARRGALQRQAVGEGWSCHELERQIAARYG